MAKNSINFYSFLPNFVLTDVHVINYVTNYNFSFCGCRLGKQLLCKGPKSIMTWSNPTFHDFVLWFLLGAVISSQACIADDHNNVTHNEEEICKATLYVDASSTRPIPKNLFGIFFEVSCYIYVELFLYM